MSQHLRPPNPVEAISNTKGRVHDLERRLARSAPVPPTYVAKWSLAGPIYVSTSGIEVHPSGGRLITVYAKLVTAGTTNTVVELLKNQSTVVGTLRFIPSQTYAETQVAVDCSARTDELQADITEAGLAAESLTVYGLFDR